MEKVKLFLEKIGTFLGDRRLWAANLAAGIILAVSYFSGDVTGLQSVFDAGFEVYDATTAVVVAVTHLAQTLILFAGVVGPYIAVIISWAKRAPSGLRFKDVVETW